mmetsp:Transcript_38945/g.71378  ORF Transcript_38945/g.71378 Transcript_38945/m.71378 type:complete len:563 (-) Transcript_38945:112-1800(-)
MIPSLTLLFTELLFLLTLPSLTLSQQQEQHCVDASTNNNDQTCTTQELPENNNNTPQQRRLPDDFVDPCQNNSPKCPQWALEGECRNNPNFMLGACARSCESCHSLGVGDGGEEEEELRDMDGTLCGRDEFDECESWAEGGECWVNPLFMHAGCRYACWKCINVHRDRQLGVDEDVIARKLLYLYMETGKQQLVRGINEKGDGNPIMTKEDHQKVGSTISKMDHYARYTMTDPSISTKARERCRNEFRMCAEWSSRGMCLYPGQPHNTNDDDNTFNRAGHDDILFMMNNCPLACRMCEELGSFHKCAGRRHPWAQPSFQSGDLHSFLEGKRVSSDEWSEYKPVFVSYPNAEKEGNKDDPYVVILQNFLSDGEADHLQTLGSTTIGWTTPSTSDTPSRNAAYVGSARCHDNDHCNNDDIYQRMMHRISSLTNSTMSHLEPMEIVHFQSSSDTQQINTLQHNFEVNSLWKPAGPRVLSLFVFLSNASEGGGGELGFPYLDWLHIRPEKGVAVLWPNVRNDNVLESDPLTTFEHFPLRSGDESFFGLNVHVRLHNWTDASVRGCA